MSVDALKNQGNEYFQCGNYEEAIKFYSMAIEQDPRHVIALGNRSASYLAISKYEEAEVDAKNALSIDKTYIKGYFRLASSLKSQNKCKEAANVAYQGLLLDPDNIALKKIKDSCAKLVKSKSIGQSRVLFGKLYDDKTLAEHYETNSKVIHDSNEEVETELFGVEKCMNDALKHVISKINGGDFGYADANNHMLQGTFKKLVEKDSFVDILFPGVPNDSLKQLPQDLHQLLNWHPIGDYVKANLMKMTRKGTSILEGVRSRGGARGDVMDHTTEQVLIPQIAQETFARELVEIVRNVSKRASSINARVNLVIASPDADQASLHQLDTECVGQLLRDRIAVQDNFLGDEWCGLVSYHIIMLYYQ
jgi:hypothetical protein